MYIHQGHLTGISLFKEPKAQDSVDLYEVVRVMRGIVLFLEDHLERLNRSAQLAGLSLPVTGQRIASDLGALIRANHLSEGNIRLLFRFGKDTEYLAYVIPHHYPSRQDYLCGVRVGILKAERSLPNAKIVQPQLREQADELMHGQNLFEVLLVHSGGFITEGSRSNFFAVRKDGVFTAPLSDVLGGVTRQRILNLCDSMRIPIFQKRIPVSDLGSYDAAFLSGTSPKVLPVSAVKDISFDVGHPVLRHIMEGYDALVEDYLMHFSTFVGRKI